uniref:Trehalose-6-phosphate synthase n=1 Tax=Arundo donax TaxID=35708 RepID=A0A0A9D6J9_ARUDO
MSNSPKFSSRTLLSLPLRTITVVRSSSQRAFKGPFKSGCNLSSISLIWSPPLLPDDSTGSVNVELKPNMSRRFLERRYCWIAV